MNNFKIFCNENVVLTVNGVSKSYIKGKWHGFLHINGKETADIRKLAIKGNTIKFVLTTDMTGCYDVTYGDKQFKVNAKNSLIEANKGVKSNKKNFKKMVKPKIETKIEETPEVKDAPEIEQPSEVDSTIPVEGETNE